MAVSISKCMLASSLILSSNVREIRCSFSDVHHRKRASLTAEDYLEINHAKNLAKVRRMLNQVEGPLESMMTIDSLQRLGIDYHFKEEIKSILGSVYKNFDGNEGIQMDNNLFQVSLRFRLLRQAGYLVPSDVFNKFTDQKGRFKLSLKEDTKGLLSLYEASHLNIGEDVLDKAQEFSSNQLTYHIERSENELARLIRRTLDHPHHMTVPRYNARYYLNHRRRKFERGGVMEDLARLDFELLQSLHQRELKEVLCWWKSMSLARELDFARDQPVKWYLWVMAMLPEPQFSKCRIKLTKVVAFVYIIDDIFDVYGSLDELLMFTNAINKWEPSAIEVIPGCMQICYMALYNMTNDFARVVLEEQGWNAIDTLKKSWAILCNAFLQEAKWFRSKDALKGDEYLRNGMLSSGVYTLMVHMFFILGHGITKENVNLLESNPSLLSLPATILRLSDDLGSAKDELQEGFDGSYMDCYMKEHPSCSAQDAKDHIMKMIHNAWQDLNKECLSQSHFPPYFVASSLNLARMVKVMYTYSEEKELPILEEYTNMLLFESI